MIVLQYFRCENFKALEELEIRFPTRCTYLLEGGNESGKTSFLDALCFAFSGSAPGGMDRHSLVKWGKGNANVRLEFAGEQLFGVLERTICRDSEDRVCFTVERGFQTHVLENERDVQKELLKTFGIDMTGLARMSFIRDVGSVDLTAQYSGESSDLVERTDLSLTKGTLADVAGLREALSLSAQRIELMEVSGRLDSLRSRHREVSRRIRLIRIAEIRDEFVKGVAEVSSLHAKLSEMNGIREAVRCDLEIAERQSATLVMIDAIERASSRLNDIESRMQVVEDSLNAATEACREIEVVKERTQAIAVALTHLGTVEKLDSERTRLQTSKNAAERKQAELRVLRQERSTLADARSSIEDELDGIRRSGAHDVMPDKTFVKARKLWADWVGTFGTESTSRVSANHESRFLPQELFSWAVDRVRGPRNEVEIDLVAEDSESQKRNREEIELTLRTNGFAVPNSIDAARTLIGSTNVDLAGGGEGGVLDREHNNETLRVTDDNLVSVIVRAKALDQEIAQLETEISGVDVMALSHRIETALQDSANALRSATTVLGSDVPPSNLAVLRTEYQELCARFLGSQGTDTDKSRLESKLGDIQIERTEAIALITDLSAKMSELWPEQFDHVGLLAADDLELVREECSMALGKRDATSLSKALTETSAQISSAELSMDVLTRRQEQIVQRLVTKVDAEGVSIRRADIEASLTKALPQLGTISISEMQGAKLEIRQLDHDIRQAGDVVEVSEQRLGEVSKDADVSRERNRAEELRHRIAVQLRASDIANRAQKRLRAKVAPKTLQNARVLLPIMTDDRYFDLRVQRNKQVDLWDEHSQEWVPLPTLAHSVRRQIGLVLRLAESITLGDPFSPGVPGFIAIDDAVLGADPKHRNRISSVLRTGLLRDTFAQVMVMASLNELEASDFDRDLALPQNECGHGQANQVISGNVVPYKLLRGTY
jgi:hypothetical protein